MILRATLPRLIAAAAACLVIGVPGLSAQTSDLRGPRLGAASNMGQGVDRDLLTFAAALGVRDLRDGISWGLAERSPGEIRFAGPRLTYPDRAVRQGVATGIVLNWGNRLYDGGDTPHSPGAVAAFGAFAAALVARFPALDHLEIGNEINGVNFVRGPLREMSALDRAAAYVPLLESAARQARAVRPEVRVIGGASHSIPAAWLWAVLDAGGAAHMDALAIHPYTTPAEQLVRQLAVLRRHPDAARLEIEVTEFGHADPAQAAGHFLRNYCQMALGGVVRAVWYPANARGDGLVPLFTPGGQITPAGRAYRLIAERMEGRPVLDIAPDPFTYGCRFGADVSVVWGMARPLPLPDGVRVLDAAGQPLAPPHALSERSPLVIVHPGLDWRPAPNRAVLADSFHQFAYPAPGAPGPVVPGDGFERFARAGEAVLPLETRPGQEAPGTPWVPYRGLPDLRPVRLTAEGLVPGRRGRIPVEIVHRYVAPGDLDLRLEAVFDLPARSEDGVTLRITAGDRLILEESGPGPFRVDRAIRLVAGEAVELAVGPNGTARGDAVRHRITLSVGR